jgi:histidine triad (HIT) family protein
MREELLNKMENPFNEEQIKKINEISKLPPEKQQDELQKFLPTLSEEQVNFLKQQQGQAEGGECFFCSLVEGKVESYKIFEDEKVVALLDIRPVNPGQVLVIPKKHVQFSTELEDVGHVFNIANKVAKKIFENYQLDTNIFLANGTHAGQRIPHLSINVIPRKEGDGAVFNFQGNEMEKEKLLGVKEKLAFEVEKKEPKEEKKEPEVWNVEERFA